MRSAARVTSARFPEVNVRLDRGDVVTTGVALAARGLALVWAGGRFAPAADGFFYHTIGARIAAGLD